MVSGHSSNPGLVPDANILFGGSGSNRTVTLKPATNQFGSTTITLTVRDGDGGAASASFLLDRKSTRLNSSHRTISYAVSCVKKTTAAIPFSIGDVETPAGTFIVSYTPSLHDALPISNILFGGSGSNRTVTLKPATNQFGSTTITLTVRDGDGGAASASFLLDRKSTRLNSSHRTISYAVSCVKKTTAAIPFSIGDVETPAGTFIVSYTPSLHDALPISNILFGGSGSNRTVTLKPATNQFGSTTITLTVRDGDGGAASASFLLSVNSVNDPPTISSVANQSTNEDTPTAAIPFSKIGRATCRDSLMVTGGSSTPDLTTDAKVLFRGSASTRTQTRRPATNQFGSTTITLTVRDGDGGAASASFLLSVNSVNDPPTISSVANQSTNEDTPTAAIPFS